MKIIYLLMAVTLLCIGCKTRQVAKSNSDSTSVKNSNVQTISQSKGIDTTKTTNTTNLQQKQDIKLVDSTGTETDITPTPGTQSTVDANGTFHGQANNIKTTRHEKKHKETTINSDLQQKQGEIKGIDTTKTIRSSVITKDSTHVKKGNKNTDAKADDSWVWAVLGAFAIILITVYLYSKRPKII